MTRTANAWENHIDDERLVDLTVGESPSEVERVHLDDCARCSESLASLVHTVSVTRDTADVELVAPREDLWARIEATLDGEVRQSSPGGAPIAMSSKSESSESSGSSESSVESSLAPAARPGPATGRRPALTWLAAACAAGALLGAGGIVVADRLTSDEPAPARTVATAELDTLDTRQALGAATVSERGDDVTLEVSVRELVPAEGYVEVWLLNRDGKRLVSVGVLRDGAERGSFPISQRILDEGYDIVDLSREQFDDKPDHSGDSLARGSLTRPA
ncbi:hypothetical protein N802_03840 [Knoellia sinensis KCTC 19936]|uniref:Anti-sigma K factor RskA C-terminal domain-containing protein n=1 Tax=Knoellia sinensis KCTC 19936 TaxID=1385520 RepID=A0A0A0J491_9MICO|nr:anti-sigma factor [Knoellia sinensis]KGN31509.1 hypothetical protein N802_03840 [Knoellia sinensis KCTC 19936]